MMLFIDAHREAYGIEPSVGSVDDGYGHALAEKVNGPCKAGVIRRRGPRRSFKAVAHATPECAGYLRHADHQQVG